MVLIARDYGKVQEKWKGTSIKVLLFVFDKLICVLGKTELKFMAPMTTLFWSHLRNTGSG